MASKFGLGSIIARIGADSSEFETVMDSVEDQIKNLQGAFSKADFTMGGAAVALGGIAKGGAGAIASVVKAAAEMEDSMNRVQAQTGLPDNMVQGFKDDMRELFVDGLGETYDEVGKGLVLAERLFKDDDKKQIARRILEISKIFEVGSDEVASTLSKMTVGFQVPFEEAADGLVKALQASGGSFNETLGAFEEYSEDFHNSGFDIGDAIAEMEYGIKEGGSFNLDKVGDSVREVMDRSKDLTDDFLDMIRHLYSEEIDSGSMSVEGIINNLKARDKGTMKQYQDIMMRIGNVGDSFVKRNFMEIAGGSISTDVGEMFFNNYEKRIGKFVETTGTADKAWKDFTEGSFEHSSLKLKNSWTDLKATIGQELLPTVIKIMEGLTKAINTANTFLKENPGFAKFLAWSLVIGTVLSSIASAILSLMVVVKAVQVILSKFGTSLGSLLKPIGNFFKGLWANVANFFKGVGGFFKWIWSGLKSLGKFISRFINPIVGIVMLVLSVLKGAYWLIEKIFGKDWANIFAEMGTPMTLLQDGFHSLLNFLVSLLPKSVQGFAQKVADIISWLTKLIALPAQMLQNLIKGETINPFKIMAKYTDGLKNGNATGDVYNFAFNGLVDKHNAQATGKGLAKGLKTANGGTF
ncbi:phage tail tape measure protein [Lysinibacillus sp. NPDC098008]|uniref:phage tail tape measure protein n=1 Tax=Lysinibacillus sp. NPDC098008 TaxID=3364146 RepID=UPI00380CA150